MEKTKISFEISATSPCQDIKVDISLDQQTIFIGTLAELPQTISWEFDDTESHRRLAINMSGKNSSHTQIDSNGDIVDDVLIKIDNVEFDGINVDMLVQKLAKYQHDFNGTQSPTVENFYGVMGCNGTVELEFDSPVYLWLLENM